ncbi:unnamed protein product [Danaus chrysippus]|uniref:(African queen) hypothetical protein n=1 Tax=Danaus chrysippus TaxID=151541 RepID=A0A8J2RBJ6_9NEOP|nr:unnamed protein product [Danaus chrysippus]
MRKRKSDLSRQTRRARRAKLARSLETEEQRIHRLQIRAQRIAAERKKVAWLKSVETFMQLQENMKDDSELKPLSIKEELSMHSSNDNFSSLKEDPLSEIKETILQTQNGAENDDAEQSPSDLLKVHRMTPHRKNNLKV